MKLAQVRKYALSLPEVTEEPHFDRTSFRVRGKIFVTARPAETHIHVFVPEEHREPALALHPGQVSKLLWGGKVVGLRVELADTAAGVRAIRFRHRSSRTRVRCLLAARMQLGLQADSGQSCHYRAVAKCDAPLGSILGRCAVPSVCLTCVQASGQIRRS